MIATLPGATLWHEGQFDGRRVRLPVFLGRRPVEPLDVELRRFHRDLSPRSRPPGCARGEWQALDRTGWPDNPSYQEIVAWCWRDGDRRHLVVVNLSAAPAQARVPLPWPDLRGRSWWLLPVLAGVPFERAGDEMVDPGLFVSLEPWGWHVLAFAGRQAKRSLGWRPALRAGSREGGEGAGLRPGPGVLTAKTASPPVGYLPVMSRRAAASPVPSSKLIAKSCMPGLWPTIASVRTLSGVSRTTASRSSRELS